MPVRFEKLRRWALTRFGQAEVVEHRRMQQLRQVAHVLQRRFRDRAPLVERPARARVGLDAAHRHAHLHLDGGQRLPDRVVELAREAAPLLFLRGDQPGRQPLEVAPVLPLGRLPPLDLVLEPADVARGDEGDDQADDDRQRGERDDPGLRAAVEQRRLGLVALARGALQRRQRVDDLENRLAGGDDALTKERGGVRRRQRPV